MHHLESVILGLQAEITLLKAEISLLGSENKALTEENAKLKVKLGLTSKNSPIHTSKELYRTKRNKVKSTRKPGGQPGHAGATRGKLVADEVIARRYRCAVV